MNEKHIRRQILDAINYSGGFAVRIWQGPFSHPGVSDIVGVYQGQPLAIEVKGPKAGPVTKEQLEFLELWIRAGGIGLIAKKYEDVVDRLGLPVK